MTRARLIVLLVLLLTVGFLATSCETARPGESSPPSKGDLAPVRSVRLIPLVGKLAHPSAEVSGLAWYGDHLIVLPQYPDRFSSVGDGLVFAITKESIIALMDGKPGAAIQVREIPFVAPGVAEKIKGFQGYEAITFLGNQAFLSIESQSGRSMLGYLVAGEISSDLSGLRLNPDKLAKLPSQSDIINMTDETLVVLDETVVTVHEANGANVNPRPVAHLFDQSLRPLGTIPFPTLEYRVTDATCPDSQGRFWVINYFFPPESSELDPAADPLAYNSGSSISRTLSTGVERLVELKYSANGITLTETKPVYLEMSKKDQFRNWEGLVRFENRGFLLMTDKFPRTLLGFVSSPPG
jgi:hypothetical protein